MRALLLGLTLAAAPAAAADAPPPAAVRDDPRVQTALELARTWLEGQRAYEGIPGVSAAIVHDQEVLWSGGFGYADREAKREATADTIYSICSISKLFTSVAVMQQRDAGRLRLDDPVGRHLPWFGLKRTEGEGDVTVEGLLTHASGLPRESDYPYWSDPTWPFPTRAQLMETVRKQEALYAPATHYQYSNLGIALAGEVAAAAAGVPYDAYVKRAILDPLAMDSTTTQMPAGERGKRLAVGYAAPDREGRRAPLAFFTAGAIGPAAGFASTPLDLARFASWQFRLLARGGTEVLKATTLREMHRIHWVEPDFETTWGLGFWVARRDDKVFVGHGGSCPGYRTQLLMRPEDRIATVFMANAQGVAAAAWAQRLYDIVAPAVKAAVKEPGKGKAPDPALRPYVGAYSVAPWGGEIAVLPWEDGLAVIDVPSMEPVKEMTRLRRTGEHTFRRVRKDDSLAEEIVFVMGADGRATHFQRHSSRWPRVR